MPEILFGGTNHAPRRKLTKENGEPYQDPKCVTTTKTCDSNDVAARKMTGQRVLIYVIQFRRMSEEKEILPFFVVPPRGGGLLSY